VSANNYDLQVTSDSETSLERRIDVLARIGQAIETAATLDELILLALYELTKFFSMSGGFIAVYDEHDTLTVLGEYPPQPGAPQSGLLNSLAVVRESLRRREALQITLDDVGAGSGAALLRARGVVAITVVPLIAQDQPLGVLLLCGGSGEPLSPAHMMLARVLASQLATAIASLRLHEAARKRSDELSTLNEIASAITSTLDTHEVYRLVVQKLSEYFHVEAGSLLLIYEPSGDLEFVMTIEGAEERLAGVVVPAGEGVVGHVVQTRQWEIVHDAQSDPRFYRKVSEDLGFVTRSILCVPMIAKGRVIGAIELLNKYDGQFEEDEAQRLTRMAAFIGVAIENARLFQQVADGRDRLAAILNSTADGILMTDMHDTLRLVNPMAARIIGVEEQALINVRLQNVLAELRQHAQEILFSRPWDSEPDGEGSTVAVGEFLFPQGPHRYSRLLRMPVRDEHDVVFGQLAMLRDVTQERELERLRDDYTNMLVHDLRAPLTSIMNGIMMVQRQLVGPVNDQQRELLKIAYQGSTTMLTLINNLLDISKMESGSMTLDLKPLSPYALIDTALERLQVSAQSLRVTIEQHLTAHVPLIEADEDKLSRVLQNLLDNAIKFSPNGGAITIGVDFCDQHHALPQTTPIHSSIDPGSWVVFWIQDRGRGIPAAYHQRIFEKFGQVRDQKVRGTGLGLAFCKLTVEAHGGYIWVESEEGQGSVFAFALPLQPPMR
jgi:PAS domain S-box-containing protein